MTDEGFGHWLAGFVDGEGCFTIRDNKGRRGESLICEFHMNLRRDDEPILQEIATWTGCGIVLRVEAIQTDGRKSNPQVRWVVSRRMELLKLVRLFDRYPLRAKKANDFAIWRQAVLLWMGTGGRARYKNHLIWRQMRRLRHELIAGRVYEPIAISEPILEPDQQMEIFA
jgi:LAGLIDADG endonuclease